VRFGRRQCTTTRGRYGHAALFGFSLALIVFLLSAKLTRAQQNTGLGGESSRNDIQHVSRCEISEALPGKSGALDAEARNVCEQLWEKILTDCETGPRICLPEKSPASEGIGCRAVRSLQSDLFGDYREYGHVSRISIEEPQIFSAVQTEWRREWDSKTRLNSNERTYQRTDDGLTQRKCMKDQMAGFSRFHPFPQGVLRSLFVTQIIPARLELPQTSQRPNTPLEVLPDHATSKCEEARKAPPQ